MFKRTATLLLTLCLLLSLPLSATAQSPRERFAHAVNSVPLNPVSPASPDLDALLDEIMYEIFTGLLPEELAQRGDAAEIAAAIESLTTYEKTLTCYNYVVATVSYGSHTAHLNTPVGNTTARAISRSHGAIEGFGAVALTARVGMCNAYASAFILMARKIGLDAYLVTGTTRNGGGGYAYHEWAEIRIDGQIFVFDPQLDQSLARQGLGSHNIFGKTYADLPGRFNKS